jgi:hypothetical protein
MKFKKIKLFLMDTKLKVTVLVGTIRNQNILLRAHMIKKYAYGIFLKEVDKLILYVNMSKQNSLKISSGFMDRLIFLLSAVKLNKFSCNDYLNL